ncbi:hypothetical protein FHR99_001471 [Litorivivens lipolytica]|uniref:Uncharacterized protein n=1 Tax=Litorivivens lipolytica TaxID=1524264 RepID=A0A7W4W4M1_9GAMM|nr:hypothetical protein [Litorivivens lipolytica]MBB3047235.1 hypothetical protein [Litorivivens lipolytica]
MSRYLILFFLTVASGYSLGGALLDRLMPFKDHFSESIEERCFGENAEPSLDAQCTLDEATRETIDVLLHGDPDQVIELESVAEAIREMLARGSSIDEVVDALPPFLQRQLPSMLRSSSCEFEHGGEVQIEFTGENVGYSTAPYEDYLELVVVCESPSQFKVVLVELADTVKTSFNAAYHPQSRVDVQLVDELHVTPARVTLMSGGALLSETVFESNGGVQVVPVLARLHAIDDSKRAPDGAGVVTGLPANARLIIYEIN